MTTVVQRNVETLIINVKNKKTNKGTIISQTHTLNALNMFYSTILLIVLLLKLLKKTFTLKSNKI